MQGEEHDMERGIEIQRLPGIVSIVSQLVVASSRQPAVLSCGAAQIVTPRATVAAGASELIDRGTKVGRRKATKTKSEDIWDVFLSYRVSTDQKLVQDLYWRLIGMDVVVNGKTRKMRPFWDAECLRSGESWEVGFCKAICRSTLVVVVMSRNALACVSCLGPDSACDNVILECALAHALVFLPAHCNFGLLSVVLITVVSCLYVYLLTLQIHCRCHANVLS